MSSPTGILFTDPRVKPMSTASLQQAACTAAFYLTGTLTSAAVYSDGALTVPMTQPVVSDAAGRFAAIYMDPSIVYRVIVKTSGGSTLSDTDPYVVPGVPAAASITTVETNAGFIASQLNLAYPQGNLLRYGIVPNSSGAATANTAALQKLLNPAILNGPTGLVYSPNTGGAAAPDTYYFNGVVQIRDGAALDLNNTTWSFTTTWVTGQTDCSFLMANAKVSIQNGSIVANSLSNTGVTFASGSAIGLGIRDGNSVFSSLFDAVFLATYGYTLGGITLRNLNISVNNPGSGALGGIGILCFSGLQDVTIENVWIDGQNTLGYGLYYEFGWATNESSRYQRQNSHAHNWNVRDVKVTNLYPSALSVGFGMNGAYNISVDGIHGSNLGQVLSFGIGEASFLNPWVGQDDIGSLPQNGQPPMTGTAAAGRQISLRNVVGRQVRGSAVIMGGNSGTSGWAQVIPAVVAWIPNTAYAAGATVYNGAYKYSTVAGGTSASASPYAGPVGTTPSTDGTVTWVFVAYAGGTGYRGWQSNQTYAANDIVANGQYLYICTTGGTAGGTFQGPTGVGTNLTDGSGGATRWSSVPNGTGLGAAPLNSAFPAFSDQLNYVLDGFDVDGATFGGTLVNFSGGQTTIRNGKITNAGFGIQSSADATLWTIDNVTILNGSSFGMRLGFTPSVWTPTRFASGVIRNCFIAGNTFGIVPSGIEALTIENCRFGYDVLHDGIAETTQQYSVFIGNGIFCTGVAINNCTTRAATSGTAYFLHDSTQADCVINNPLGPLQTYSGPWEGVLQSQNITLTCGTPGDLAVTYTTQKFDYIKRQSKIDYTLEIITSAFTHTTSSGSVTIGNLPFPASNSVGSLPMGSLAVQGITKASYTSFNLQGSGGASTLTIDCSGSAQTLATLAITDMPTGGTVKLLGSGSYFTNA